MVKRMLIDATHSEETRVVVVNGTRLEELDVETSTKKQLKGNIYLAKVVRVEPSLQAAFVDYGGNRHGFLAFSEIHPDYFQIPIADRQALLAAQNADHFREAADLHDSHDGASANGSDSVSGNNGAGDIGAEGNGAVIAVGDGDATKPQEENGEAPSADANPPRSSVEVVGGDDASEQELERRRARLLRNYKIQEVIKRRQIMLVQVVKEERGNKGAALTTYLSLAGRYCVLMPNTARGGGVSRKIINPSDRKRLKVIAQEMEIPDGMAVIIRTAGSERSKAEIRRDYEYLLRMWDNVRELTLKSSAPSLVYEEASLIKRSIRDLYSRDIDEVLVDGDEGYRLAKDYMRMLTPSHAKKVQPYKDPTMPMFHRYQVENQLDAMHSPVVQLRSGGYIVISQTEALVAIDVNSGRATKERHIEETALKTNLEAAEEIARQLRLRDLAGLIVIDFIDMEESRNNHAVERRLKEALKNDRARIQVGRISPFGLLELSRQRLRPSLQETTFTPCPHCAGTGLIRSVESAAVHVLRAIEEEGIRRRSSEVTVSVPTVIALYILNQKRDALAAIEERYQFRVLLSGDDTLIPPAYRMERVKAEFRAEEIRMPAMALSAPAVVEEEPEGAEPLEAVDEDAEAAVVVDSEGNDGGDAGRKRRRRRRRKRREHPNQAELAESADAEEEKEAAEDESQDSETGEEGGEEIVGEQEAEEGNGDDGRHKKRRRGRRGGRRRRGRETPAFETAEAEMLTADAIADVFEAAEAAEEAAASSIRQVEPMETESQPEAVAPMTVEPAIAVAVAAEPASAPEAAMEAGVESEVPAMEPAVEKPKRKRAPRKKAAEAVSEEKAKPEATAEEKPKRKRAPRKKAAAVEVTDADEITAAETSAEAGSPQPLAAEPSSAEIGEPLQAQPVADTAEAAPEVEAARPAPELEVKAARKGWWNKATS